VSFCGFPPLRQKQGARMGHGVLEAGLTVQSPFSKELEKGAFAHLSRIWFYDLRPRSLRQVFPSRSNRRSAHSGPHFPAK